MLEAVGIGYALSLRCGDERFGAAKSAAQLSLGSNLSLPLLLRPGNHVAVGKASVPRFVKRTRVWGALDAIIQRLRAAGIVS